MPVPSRKFIGISDIERSLNPKLEPLEVCQLAIDMATPTRSMATEYELFKWVSGKGWVAVDIRNHKSLL